MLKLNYTESGLHMERVTTSLEELVQKRALLALRAGQSLYVEPGKAAFLLPANVPGLTHLELALQMEQNQNITVCPVDDEFVEVSLEGTWIAPCADAHEGTFVTGVSDRAEFFVYKLWQVTQSQVSSIAQG